MNKAYVPKATEYVKNAIKKNNPGPRQKSILTDFVKIGEFLQLGRSEQISSASNLNIKHKIFRECFTCKGSRFIKRKNRCKVCKAKGKCITCGGDGQTSRIRGDYIYYYSCTVCTSGECTTCKGTRYVGGACDKCYLTDGSIDTTKAKFVLLKLLKEYISLEKEQPNDQKNEQDKIENVINVSIAEIHYSVLKFKGFFIRNKGNLQVLFRTSEILDPTKLKCVFEGKEFNYSEIFYSEKYKAYKLNLEQNEVSVNIADITPYDNRSIGYVMSEKGAKHVFYQVDTSADITDAHLSNGIVLVQDRKVCAFLGEDSIVDRSNVSKWFERGGHFISIKGAVAFRTDFKTSFVRLKKEDLEFDLLYLSQYIEEEKKLLHLAFNKKIKTKDQLGLDYLVELKQSFSKNKWKTVWAKKAAEAFIDTISQLERVKF